MNTDQPKAPRSKISMRVEQSVQVNSFCHQRVTFGVHDLDVADATDENLQALLDGPAKRTFDHLSKAVRKGCDELREGELERMVRETEEVRLRLVDGTCPHETLFNVQVVEDHGKTQDVCGNCVDCRAIVPGIRHKAQDQIEWLRGNSGPSDQTHMANAIAEACCQ